MFTKARIKLTTWYLLIIMTISFSFSVFIYTLVTAELHRRLMAIETRLNLQRRGVALGQPTGDLYVLIDDLQEAKDKILSILINTNLTIFMVSAVGGYFLAGKTLSPIESAMEDQKRFVSDAGHELKTPLTSLQTSIEVTLRDNKLTLKDAKEELRESLSDIKKLTVLTNNLLMLSRMQNNGNSFNKTENNIKNIVMNVVEKLKPIANKNKIKIIVITKTVTANVDVESFENLLRIVVDNAIKYSNEKGKIYVSLKNYRTSFEVIVADEGIGISKKHLPRIFDRFYRVDISRTKGGVTGYGLGLSIAKKIVENHKGSISVTSIEGKGTTVRVKLPKS